MSPRKVNVLVYAGSGTTIASVRHTTWSLRRLLGPHYAVFTITSDQLLREPWTSTCALLVIPGGADLSYSRTLNGAGNRKIKQYVQLGGAYLGLCAGGYYGSARCEFEVGKDLEVVGDRELAFFPGTCRGLAFPGFEYHSEAGARPAQLEVDQTLLSAVPALRTYYNGGGVFVDAEQYPTVQILARYTEPLAVEGGNAAVVYCKVGDGAAILTGPHPEFSGLNMSADGADPRVVDAITADESFCVQFLRACLKKLDLLVEDDDQAIPSLSKLHLSAAQPELVSELVSSWRSTGLLKETNNTINGENDTFIIESSGWSMQSLTDAVESALDVDDHTAVDFNSVPKRIVAHENKLPENKETPCFNHAAFYASIRRLQGQLRDHEGQFGKRLLYGEVVTSTSTLLEKNASLLSTLPNGFTATATTQVAGRGRGSNVWVSPPGSLMFSTVLRHSFALSSLAPVVFVQYLAALATVAGIQNYDKGYEKVPIRLKWPNDIYATTGDGHVKVGGILVNSSYAGGDYTLVCGIGLNVNNSAPTTSVSMLAEQAGLAQLSLERLLASILVQFESMYTRFCQTGFDEHFLDQYHKSWLHSNQVVTLETEGGARARITGITRDWGLLRAEELGWEDRPTGKTFELQSDSNSFDFFKGLLEKKL